MACDQNWTVCEGELARGDVQRLLAAHVEEMRTSSPADACHVLASSGLEDSSIRFFALRDGTSTLLGIGALKALDADHGEVKSMRVAPAALGRGVGGAILHHLLDTAREAGMVRVSLETGNHPLFTPARELYRRAGFLPCEPFGTYRPTPFTLFFSLDLAA